MCNKQKQAESHDWICLLHFHLLWLYKSHTALFLSNPPACSNQLKEVRNARKQQRLAAAAAIENRIVEQKASGKAKNCDKKHQAEAKTLQTLEAGEKEFWKRYNQFQARSQASCILLAESQCSRQAM